MVETCCISEESPCENVLIFHQFIFVALPFFLLEVCIKKTPFHARAIQRNLPMKNSKQKFFSLL